MMSIVSPKHVEPIRSTIKHQVASSWFFYSSVITMMHGPINIRFIGREFSFPFLI